MLYDMIRDNQYYVCVRTWIMFDNEITLEIITGYSNIMWIS